MDDLQTCATGEIWGPIIFLTIFIVILFVVCYAIYYFVNRAEANTLDPENVHPSIKTDSQDKVASTLVHNVGSKQHPVNNHASDLEHAHDPWITRTTASPGGEHTDDSGDGFKDHVSCLQRSIGRARWQKGKCVCKPKYFGAYCQHVLHHDDYTAVGPYNNTLYNTNIHKEVRSDHISFESDSCTAHCDKYSCCSAVSVHNDGDPMLTGKKYSCLLHHGQIVVKPDKEIPYVPDGDTDLYIHHTRHSGHAPIFKDRLFIGNTTRLPHRYWHNNFYHEGDDFVMALRDNSNQKLQFIPLVVINNSGCDQGPCIYGDELILILSNTMLPDNTLGDIVLMGGNSNSIIIRGSNDNIQIPSDWENVYAAVIRDLT